MGIENVIKDSKTIMDNDKGASEYSQFVEQLSWLLFLKIYDDKELLWEFEEINYESVIPKQLRWRNWANSKTADGKEDKDALTGEALLTFINNDLFPTLKDLEVTEDTPKRAALVKYIFQDANNFMKDGVLLRQIINKLNDVDFNDGKVKLDFIKQFEAMLIELQASKKKEIIYSPRVCTDFVIEVLKPQLGEKVADFACGTGGFLTSTLKHLKDQIKSIEEIESVEKQLLGVEKKALPYRLSLLNLLLNDVDAPNVMHDNSLSYSIRDFNEIDKVDVIAMNPPFGGNEESSIKNNFPVEMRTSETADLFMAMVLYRLKMNGRAAIILHDGFLFGTETSTLAIKKKLLEECNLHTVLRLPKGVFKITTNILFFDKGIPTKDIWFYEHQVGHGGAHYTKTKSIRYNDFNPEREWWNNREENEFAWKVSIEDLVATNYNLDIKNPTKKDELFMNSRECIESLEQVFNESKDLLESMKSLLNY